VYLEDVGVFLDDMGEFLIFFNFIDRDDKLVGDGNNNMVVGNLFIGCYTDHSCIFLTEVCWIEE
jgi:hypothetical protein